MTLADFIALFEKRVSDNGGALPESVKLTRYQNFTDWLMPGETATEEDFRAAQNLNDQFAGFLSDRGVKVIGVTFDPASYRRWLGSRADTRNNRARWSLVGKRKLHLAFVMGAASTYTSAGNIGWAVLETDEN